MASKYTVTMIEEHAEATQWLYVVASSPEEAVREALRKSSMHGYPIERAWVRVWDSAVQGATYGHEPLHEEWAEPLSLSPMAVQS